MQVACVVDGRMFEAKRSTAKYCGERCKKKAQRDPTRVHIGRDSGTAQPLASVTRIAAGSDSVAAGVGVWRRTHDELVKADRLETVAGAIALALASKLDDPGLDTGSSVAALAKQLQAQVDRALDGVDAAATPLEEIRKALKLA